MIGFSTLTFLSMASIVASSVAQESTPFAYVTLLCDTVEEEQTDYIRMLLVLKESIRQFDETNDIVTMVHGSLQEEQWELLDQEGFKVLTVDDVGVEASNPEPLHVPADVSACYRAKLNALELTQYERVIFLDSDVLVKRDLRFMFEGDGFVAYDGYESPLNAGFFAVAPSSNAFDDIRAIASSDSFHPIDGWMGYGPFPHWRLEGHMSDWSFWCAHTDQGILYYYFDKVLGDATILPMKEGSKLVTHFTGWSKPVLHNSREASATGVGANDSSSSLAEWYRVWDRVQSRLGTSVVETEKKTTSLKGGDVATARRTLATADPYCDAYDEVYLMLYNSDTNEPVGPLPDVVDGCVSEGLTIVAMPPCKDKVKFKLLDGSGEQVYKDVEGVAPFTISGDDGDDLYPFDFLKIPDSYTLEVNPAPGAKQSFHYEVTGC